MEVRRTGADDWAALRRLRLRALADAPGRAHLVSMWVDPAHRRRGVALALIDRAIGWATERHADEVILWVADQNATARRLYEQVGFRPTGERQPLPSDPTWSESLMHLPLPRGPGGGAGPGRGGRRRPGPRSARP
jgi:ribosomal protein S18 acetylase RimI-like enzyme